MAQFAEKFFKIKGIKCDNPRCYYRNEDVKFEDYDRWLEVPCPKCGQPLLTLEDYLKCKKMIDLLNKIEDSFIMKIIARILLFFSRKKTKLIMNGTGKIWRSDTKEEMFKKL